MNVKACMSTDVQLASPSETIGDAARMMAQNDVGLLPVGENDRLVGMITDRDIAVRAVAQRRGPETPVREIMTREVQYCFEDDDLDEVAMQMSDLQVRRLPVLNRDKRLVGIISLADISRAGDNRLDRTAAVVAGVSAPGGAHSQGRDGAARI